MPKEGCCCPARAHSHRQMRAARLTLGSESRNPPSGRNNFLLSSCVTVTSKGSSPQSPHEEKGCHNTSDTTQWDICTGKKKRKK